MSRKCEREASPRALTPPPSHIGPLRGLLEVTRLLRADEDLPELLEAIARTIAESLGYRTVAISLYRPAWDDFSITTVHGNANARGVVLAQASSLAEWQPLLADRSGNAVFVPMRDSAGHLLGVLSVDEPATGRRAGEEELDVLVALADHAALAVQGAQESAEAARHRLALEQLLDVSSRLTAEPIADEILRAVCRGVHDALGFQNVAAQLLDATTGRLERRAAVGWSVEGGSNAPVLLADIQPLLDPDFEIEGCYLLPNDEAERRLAGDKAVYVSNQNGSGPWAWDRHWLLVPLLDSTGQVLGIIWADEPEDRLLPSAERLQALRIFANQAAAAIVSAAQRQELRFLADHDPLTRLLNRRAFVERLDGEVARATRYGHSFGLVLCDLDGFKELNDTYGHPAGDGALRLFARTLKESLRKGDEAFRIGGDEFALLLAEASEEAAREVVHRVSEELTDLRASFGVASCPADANDATSLFRLADAALYEAKRSGEGLKFVA
jgi:diguanylate cyclase (GGDEF)-like protein